MYIRSFFLASVVAGLYLALGAGPAAAQSSVGLTPTIVEASVKQNAAFTQTFTISNGTATRLRFSMSVNDYWNDENNNRVLGRPGTLPRSASAWLQFSPSEIVVEPGTSSVVTLTITVPAAADGGHYAMCFFEGKPVDAPASSPESSATITLRIGAALLLSVEGTSQYDVAVVGSKLAPPAAATELEAELDMINRGNAHARMNGMFAILDATGRLAGRGRVPEKRFFPGQRDTYRMPWAGELAPGRYTLVITLKYDRAGTTPGSLLYELPFDVVAP